MHETQDLDEMLRLLRLPRIRATWEESVDRAAREGWSGADLLRHILSDELSSRDESRLKRSLSRADFPFHRTLEDFDFRCRPEVRRAVFQTYLEDSFVREGRSLVLIGPPGLGKTHLGVAIGLCAIQRYLHVRFVTVQSLLNRVLRTEVGRERERILRPYKQCDLLILDEFGYLNPEPAAGAVLYELIADRYERRATVIPSNKSLTEWGRVLHDTSLASALVDRLMHHGDVYYLKGESYRLRGKPRQKVTQPSSQDPEVPEAPAPAGRGAEA